MIHNHEVTSSILVLATQKALTVLWVLFFPGFSFFCCLQSQAPQGKGSLGLKKKASRSCGGRGYP